MSISSMNARLASILTAVLAALLLASPVAASGDTVRIWADNGRSYHPVAFYYVYGDHIEWWQGGAKFVLGTNTPEYKVIEEFFIALPSKLGIEVLAGELHLVSGYLRAEYVFDGIVRFKDYLFVDNAGLIVIEWQYQKGLNVTIYSKATVDLSKSEIRGYGFADWKPRIVGYGKICSPILGCRVQPIIDDTPVAEIPAGSEVLVVPAEGVVLEEDYRGYAQYLGGGPNLKHVDRSRRIRGGQVFWDREPDYWLFYNAEGLAEIWKVDNWFNEAVQIWPVPHEVKVAEVR